jgi:antitoxin component YwqK of YwqJK toxin-antitoxin module
VVRKIGYYSNGNLDHDFRSEDGKSIGCERMWRENGDPYVEAYYSAPGIKDGYQRTWQADSILVMEALCEDGEIIYQINYDIDGNITNQKGNKPE